MTIGDRIKLKREEMGLTQEELAIKLGYKSRSSVNKVENSRELSNKKVIKYAEALNTTPSYLMGWSSDSELSLFELMFKDDPEKLMKLQKDAYVSKIKALSIEIATKPLLEKIFTIAQSLDEEQLQDLLKYVDMLSKYDR